MKSGALKLSCEICEIFKNNYFEEYLCRPNVSLVAHYSLQFTRCPLFAVKSLLALCKKSLVTRWEIRSLLVAEVARCKLSFITRYKIRLL